MRPLVRTTTFNRTPADMDRIVKLVTVLHGRLYRPGNRYRAGKLFRPGKQGADGR
jgi:hypothetical protein